MSQPTEPQWDSSLIKIKVSQTESAYLAASSPELARQLRELHPSAEGLRIVEGSELGPRAYRDFATTRVLCIDSADTLRSFEASRTTTFPYAQHLRSYVGEGDN